jgi:hypothetical protein
VSPDDVHGGGAEQEEVVGVVAGRVQVLPGLGVFQLAVSGEPAELLVAQNRPAGHPVVVHALMLPVPTEYRLETR